jgi:hypothetical protein
MPDRIINRAADLMREQATAYRRLKAACDLLAAALVRGDPEQIETLTRTGEKELLGLRSRLAQITSTLSSFAALRASAPDKTPVSEDVRGSFETASKELISRARDFQSVHGRTAALAINGIAFAGVCIEMCGVQPTTYNGPYGRRASIR